MSEAKITQAESQFKIITDCPYCDEYLNVTDRLKECLPIDSLSENNLEEEITCDKCKLLFYIDEITY